MSEFEKYLIERNITGLSIQHNYQGEWTTQGKTLFNTIVQTFGLKLPDFKKQGNFSSIWQNCVWYVVERISTIFWKRGMRCHPNKIDKNTGLGVSVYTLYEGMCKLHLFRNYSVQQ